jgi:hypothetical protein
MIEYPDRRMKAIIFTMASSGIRLGAWDYLQWKDIELITRDGKTVVATDIGPAQKAPFELIVSSASVPISQIDH